MNKIIIILCLSVTYLHSQNKGIITLPVGEGAGGDSLGNVIPDTRVLLGQGTNLATSTDSLVWDAGFEVTGPVRFLALPNLTESAGDSLLMINNLGTVFKTSTNVNNFVSADLTGVANRTHDFENYNLSIIDVGTFFLEADVLFNVKTTSNLNAVSGWDGLGLTLKGEDIYLNSTDIILQNTLTINNNWDTILVRNPITGEIQGRDASSFGGGSADSLGANVTAGRVVFGLGNKTPGNSANLFWDNSSSELAIGHTSPSADLHVISTDPTNRSSIIGQNDNSATAFTSTFAAMSLRNNNTTANNYVRFNFQDASSTAAAAIASQITDHSNDYGTLEFWTRSSGGFSQKMVIVEGGNVGIGTTPNTYGKLDISSTTGALIVPRMTTTQRDAMTATAGMIIYNTTTATFQGYTTAWNNL